MQMLRALACLAVLMVTSPVAALPDPSTLLLPIEGRDDRDDDDGDGDAGCRRNSDCDDRNACNGAERCLRATGTCLPGVPPVCDDGDPCNGTESCNPDDGCTRGTPPDNCGNVDPCLLAPDGTPCASDGVRCTSDTCRSGACTHTPDPSRCDAAETCTAAACSPDDAGADGDGCVVSPVGEGDPCTDDGVACTDDVCRDGVCQHVPIDSRCEPAGGCATAACVPGSGDASGCVPGHTEQDGGFCSEDGNPCTTDVCEAGTCVHTSVERPELCMPLADPFRQALALGALARSIQSDVVTAPLTASARVDPRIDLAARLEPVAASLELAASTLAGGPDAAPGQPDRSPDPLETLAAERARAALPICTGIRKPVATFVRALTGVQTRVLLDPDRARDLRRRSKTLLDGTRKLRRGIRRLMRVTGTFAR